MSRTIHFSLAVTVPDYAAPVTPEHLAHLLVADAKKELNGGVSLKVKGGDFGVVGKPLLDDRVNWKKRIFNYLTISRGRRFTTAEMAYLLEIQLSEAEARKALGETLERMATGKLIRRERQAGFREWSYFL